MRSTFAALLGVVLVLAQFCPVIAASDEAKKLRKANSLSVFSPPQSFLDGNFVADEIEPKYIFGKVKDFVKSRSCPNTWLIEDSEKARIESHNQQTGPIEYTLYLEEDCPGKVIHYIFIDRSQANTAQWLEWRKQFHKSKAEPQYASAMACMDKAAGDGFQVDAELRFIEFGNQLELKKTEDLLIGMLGFRPIYDLRRGMAFPQQPDSSTRKKAK